LLGDRSEMTPITLNCRVSPNEYIVRTPTVETPLRTKLTALGWIETLATDPNLMLLRLPDLGEGEPKAGWERVRVFAGAQATVHPVLVDDDGVSRYPLGTITVRFKSPPSDQMIQEVENRFGLVVKKRNKYAPTQVSFSTASDSCYLPEKLEEVSGESDFEGVWPDTMSAYTRQ